MLYLAMISVWKKAREREREREKERLPHSRELHASFKSCFFLQCCTLALNLHRCPATLSHKSVRKSKKKKKKIPWSGSLV